MPTTRCENPPVLLVNNTIKNTVFLPRQARDNHEDRLRNEWRFLTVDASSGDQARGDDGGCDGAHGKKATTTRGVTSYGVGCPMETTVYPDRLRTDSSN